MKNVQGEGDGVDTTRVTRDGAASDWPGSTSSIAAPRSPALWAPEEWERDAREAERETCRTIGGARRVLVRRLACLAAIREELLFDVLPGTHWRELRQTARDSGFTAASHAFRAGFALACDETASSHCLYSAAEAARLHVEALARRPALVRHGIGEHVPDGEESAEDDARWNSSEVRDETSCDDASAEPAGDDSESDDGDDAASERDDESGKSKRRAKRGSLARSWGYVVAVARHFRERPRLIATRATATWVVTLYDVGNDGGDGTAITHNNVLFYLDNFTAPSRDPDDEGPMQAWSDRDIAATALRSLGHDAARFEVSARVARSRAKKIGAAVKKRRGRASP